MPIVINGGQYKLPLSFIDLTLISYELEPILDECRWIIANWWYRAGFEIRRFRKKLKVKKTQSRGKNSKLKQIFEKNSGNLLKISMMTSYLYSNGDVIM